MEKDRPLTKSSIQCLGYFYQYVIVNHDAWKVSYIGQNTTGTVFESNLVV